MKNNFYLENTHSPTSNLQLNMFECNLWMVQRLFSSTRDLSSVWLGVDIFLLFFGELCVRVAEMRDFAQFCLVHGL